MKSLLIAFAFSFMCLMAYSQSSNYNRWFVNVGDSILIDTMTIVQPLIQVKTNNKILIEGIDFKMNYFTGYLLFTSINRSDSILVTYNKLSIPLHIPYAKKPKSLIIPKVSGIRYDQGYSADKSQNRFNLFTDNGLKMNGSISRGLGFGNNQDVVLNANLNLQLSGTINNDIDVVAAISDDNNPIQPEGNTQQLQDFDRVFIQLSKKNTTLIVGDFEMNKPEGSYFLNYYKKSRGAQVNTITPIGKNGKLKINGEGALSRGRFTRNIINGIEGNQGPYRLSGPNGELFIIVISGTEAVYIDGQKLVRGEQNDYVIDYNTGEITFMPRRPITQYSRIVVEFQFSDRNYARSVFHLNSIYEQKGYQIRVNYFTEQDNKNQPFLQNLSDSAKRILAAVGDNLQDAFINSEVLTTFDARRILYRKIDSLGFNNIYVHAPVKGNDSIFYEVRFSLVGANRGNYKLGNTSANGRVFIWIPPVDGVPQGDHEPVIQLVSPKRNQMLSIGTEITAIKNTTIQLELARSITDKNTFATTDKANDGGFAIKAGVLYQLPLLKNGNIKVWQMKNEIQFEFTEANFRFIERYRPVEFDRNWNRLLTNTNVPVDTGFKEYITSLKTAIQHYKNGQLYYQLGWYNRASAFTGTQQQAGFVFTSGKYQISGDGELLRTTNNIQEQRSEVNRYKIELNRQLYRFLAGLKVEQEQSSFLRNQDTLLSGSFGYIQYGAFVKNNDTSRTKFKMEYQERTDFLPKNNELNTSTIGRNLITSAEHLQKNGNRLSAGFTMRTFNIKDTGIIKAQPERTLLSRIEYDYHFIKRVFTANTYYQIGSGQELRRDFQYVEVLVGQGQYVWKDFNNDGIQQLNEFLPAGAAERPQANYIRIFLPTNSFIGTHLNQFNQTLLINPAMVWNNKKGIRKIISKFTNQTAFKTDRKTTRLETFDFLNPFTININDTSLITINAVFRNTLFFNRSNPTFGGDLTYQNQRSKIFLTNGFDARNKTEQQLNLRWNINAIWSINGGINTGVRMLTSDFFSENNFNYTFIEYKPKVIYQLSTQMRITFLYSYFEAQNAPALGNQFSTTNEFGTELRYSVAKQGVLNGKFSYYEIRFNGNAQSQLGYDILQGLVPGANRVWNVNYQQRIGKSLQITINYDGRNADNQDTVHIGRMEARYLF
ncbi:MAG: hypothetical protein MUC81_08940 [Bacteroidia bacterium]|jgi:hypothetical protein|nr:hypothetical protein [Bacteroidia bacterium]